MRPLTIALFALASWGAAAETPPLRKPETPAEHDARMAWWRQAKFGMFIHWGLYAIPADGEWHLRKHQMPVAEYAKFAQRFNPVKFSADTWTQVAQDAGMKYLVLTTKHHDGFALFKSAASSFNIVDATPFKRDVLKELSEACPKRGLTLGTYYSVIADWSHPGGGAGCPPWDKAQEGDLDAYIDRVSIPQVKELLSNYGPIGVLWFDSDGAQPKTAAQAARYADAIALQPNIIVDPRLRGFPGDFETCEGHIPLQPPKGDWELCTRTNGNWGYTGAPARSRNALLSELCEAWGKGGNVLLNVGPNAEGEIPADSVTRLRDLGAWLKINGEAIYGSTRSPFDHLPWGYATRQGTKLYCLVLRWPADGRLRLPMANAVTRAWLPGAPEIPVSAQVSDGITTLQVPTTAPDADASVIGLEVTGDIPTYRSLTLNRPVTATDNPRGAAATVNGGAGGDWRIAKDRGSLTVDLGQPRTFATLRLTCPYTQVAQLDLEVQDGTTWKPVWNVTKPKGTTWIVDLPPTTAQVVRLTVAAAKPELRVGVFELFPPL